MTKIAILERTQYQEELRSLISPPESELVFYTSRTDLVNAVQEDPTIDLIIANVALLNISGVSNIRELKTIPGRLHVPLLLIAPQESLPLKTAALKDGANDFMVKPLSAPEFSARIENLVRSKKYVEALVQEKIHYQELAERDFRTGLPNRGFLLQRLTEEASRAERHQGIFSVMLMEIDDFHLITVRYGYDAGEEILTRLAGLIRENLRKEDILGRFGLSELMLIIPQTEMTGAASAAEKLRMKIENTPFPTAEGNILLTISGAITTYNPREVLLASPPNLVMKLDAALKEGSKKNQKNRITYLPTK